MWLLRHCGFRGIKPLLLHVLAFVIFVAKIFGSGLPGFWNGLVNEFIVRTKHGWAAIGYLQVGKTSDRDLQQPILG